MPSEQNKSRRWLVETVDVVTRLLAFLVEEARLFKIMYDRELSTFLLFFISCFSLTGNSTVDLRNLGKEQNNYVFFKN